MSAVAESSSIDNGLNASAEMTLIVTTTHQPSPDAHKSDDATHSSPKNDDTSEGWTDNESGYHENEDENRNCGCDVEQNGHSQPQSQGMLSGLCTDLMPQYLE